jgi:hypothetical protein
VYGVLAGRPDPIAKPRSSDFVISPLPRNAGQPRISVSTYGEAGLDDSFIGLVRGPSSRLPRGYIWLLPAWFVILSAAVLLIGWLIGGGSLPLWLAGTELIALALAFITLGSVAATVRHPTFRVDANGILLGSRTTRKRPGRRVVVLPWQVIERIRMVTRHDGVLLEITLGPSAPIVHRAGWARQTLLWFGMLLLPVGVGRDRPALTEPLADPPRYLVRLCDTSPQELRLVLGPLKPPNVPVNLLTRRNGLRFAVPMPPPVPGGGRPASPAVRG